MIHNEEELRKKAFNNILSNKYFINGKCLNCGEEYAYCTNRKSSHSFRDCYCSDECWKEFKKFERKIKREQHHYEVSKDDKFYYIIVDGNFSEKRNFEGKTWMKKSEQEKQRMKDNSKRVLNWKIPILPESSKVPKESVKIIDKVSTFLYDDKHKFYDLKNLKVLSNSSSPGTFPNGNSAKAAHSNAKK